MNQGLIHMQEVDQVVVRPAQVGEGRSVESLFNIRVHQVQCLLPPCVTIHIMCEGWEGLEGILYDLSHLRS
ncbi:hypothetical protein EXN66_Car000926 [Channa argus]|uniref:Uncharacterized protein n=1 Tax=Channa argus TaxID=215402 RepID=A0A6G1QZJ5_CHAAH|nr:hypothetical protein EXN66_Car000926 [Channa argus]